MTTLNFDRNSGRVPVVDAESGNILGESFLPMFYRGSFRLAGIAALQDEKPALLFTPPEIVFINKVCALVKPEAAHEKGEITEDADFAPMEQVTVFAQGAVPMGRISSISVDQKTGLPAGFTVEPLPAEGALRCAPAPREDTCEEAPAEEPTPCEEAPAEEPQAEPEVPCEEQPRECEEKEPEVCAEEPVPCGEAPAEEPQAEPDVPCEEQPRECEEKEPEVCAEAPVPCGEAPDEEPQAEPEVPCEELPCICEEAPEVCAEEPAPCGEAPAEEPQAEPEAFEEPSDELPTIEWLLADKGAGVNVPPVTIDMPAEGQPALEKALTAEPAENADPMAYEAYYEDTTPEQFLRKLEGLLGPAAFDKSVIPEPPQMINSELFEPDVIGEMPRTEELPAEEPAQAEPKEAAAAQPEEAHAEEPVPAAQPEETPAGEPKAAPRRTLDMAELLAEKYEAQEAAETAAKAREAKPEATEPEAQAEKSAAGPEAAEPEETPAEEPAVEPETSEPEEPAQAEPEETPAAQPEETPAEEPAAGPETSEPEEPVQAEPEEAPAAQPEDAPAEEPAAEPETSEPEEPAQAEPEEAPAAQPEVTPAEEPAPAAPPASGSEVNFRNTASYRPEEFNLNAPEDYYRPNINYKKELQKMNGSQILGMLLFAGACVLAALV